MLCPIEAHHSLNVATQATLSHGEVVKRLQGLHAALPMLAELQAEDIEGRYETLKQQITQKTDQAAALVSSVFERAHPNASTQALLQLKAELSPAQLQQVLSSYDEAQIHTLYDQYPEQRNDMLRIATENPSLPGMDTLHALGAHRQNWGTTVSKDLRDAISRAADWRKTNNGVLERLYKAYPERGAELARATMRTGWRNLLILIELGCPAPKLTLEDVNAFLWGWWWSSTTLKDDDYNTILNFLKAGSAAELFENGQHGEVLHRAIHRSEGGSDAVRLCLALGVPTGSKDKEGYTPLLRAVSDESYASAMLLLEAGAKPNTRTPQGYDALSLLIEGSWYHSGRDALLAALIEHGADGQARLPGGQNVLHRLVETHNPFVPEEFLRKLVKLGVDINALDDEGRTPRDYAMRWETRLVFRNLGGKSVNSKRGDDNGVCIDKFGLCIDTCLSVCDG